MKLVKFIVIKNKISIDKKLAYIIEINKCLYSTALITKENTSVWDDKWVEEINSNSFYINYEYENSFGKSEFSLLYEFGTFEECAQLAISINVDIYNLCIENKYLEQLKMNIKNIVKSDWQNIIWLYDAESEMLACELYPIIHKAENSLRYLINEVMNKSYGANWWEQFIPFNIKEKHSHRLKDYKATAPGFNNIDERLLSIDISDLKTILTLKFFKWVPSYNSQIEASLQGNQKYNHDIIQDQLKKQLTIVNDLWKEQFSDFLPDTFIDKLERFDLNRNHVAHNKLIDRSAFESINQTAKDVFNDINKALDKIDCHLPSNEELEILIEDREQERLEIQLEMMETDANIRIRNYGEIIDMFDDCMQDLYNSLTLDLRFRQDINFSRFTTLDNKSKKANISGSFIEINHKISNKKLNLLYTLTIDELRGETSTLIIYTQNENVKLFLEYINGDAEYDSYLRYYVPLYEGNIPDPDEIEEELVDFINDYFENLRTKVDQDMYSIIKDGGDSPISDIPCNFCDEPYVCVNEEYAPFGTCLNCGEHNDISKCERCGCYFEDESENDDIKICQNCLASIYKE